jgi:Nickel responsive protein SCO4226-like
VRFLRSVFVPEDETCFYLYEATSAEAVRTAARRAALAVEDVVKAASEPSGTSR